MRKLHYVPVADEEKQRISAFEGQAIYLHPDMTQFIDRPIHAVCEIGSRDGIDALKLSEHYQCHVFCFECNPLTLDICRSTIGENPNVTLVKKAVWHETKPIPFYPVVPVEGQHYNPGASSCFRVDRTGMLGRCQQVKTTVSATRLDDWIKTSPVDNIDLLCIDVQGASLNVFKGATQCLDHVKYIICEFDQKQNYIGSELHPACHDFLTEKGFVFVKGFNRASECDYLYVKKQYLCS